MAKDSLQFGEISATRVQGQNATIFNPGSESDPLSFLDDYERIANSDDPNLRLVTGSAEDRLAGLEPLLAEAGGCSVLDVACHVGLNAAAFAKAGASLVDGFDFWRPGVEQARKNLEEFPIPARFAVCDLRNGLDDVRANLAPLPDAYDIVLYLGIHHHLLRQMERAKVEAIATEFASMARKYVAVRTPAHSMDSATAAITAAGFELWRENDKTNTRDGKVNTVSGLKIFVRT